MIKYLRDRAKIVESKQTETPRWGMAADGYTLRGGAPTSRMIRLEGEKRFRRLMVICFSNSGSCFVRIKGEMLFVDEFDLPVIVG